MNTPSGRTKQRATLARRLLQRASRSLAPHGDAFWEALRCLGMCAWLIPPPVLFPHLRSVTPFVGGLIGEPPPNHPERLATDVPPSPVELRLWAQLTGEVR